MTTNPPEPPSPLPTGRRRDIAGPQMEAVARAGPMELIARNTIKQRIQVCLFGLLAAALIYTATILDTAIRYASLTEWTSDTDQSLRLLAILQIMAIASVLATTARHSLHYDAAQHIFVLSKRSLWGHESREVRASWIRFIDIQPASLACNHVILAHLIDGTTVELLPAHASFPQCKSPEGMNATYSHIKRLAGVT